MGGALSLLAYFGTIVVVGWTGLRIAGRWCGIITAVLTASSTLLVLKSLNARPYVLSALLVALCAVYLFKWLDDPRARWLWVFSILALLATAMQLFSLLAPASMLICVLLVRPALIAERLRNLLAPIALLAVASGAWIIACTREVAQVNWIGMNRPTVDCWQRSEAPLSASCTTLSYLSSWCSLLPNLPHVGNRDVRGAVIEQVSRDRDILALTFGWAVIPTVVPPSPRSPIRSIRTGRRGIGPRGRLTRGVRLRARVSKNPGPVPRFGSDDNRKQLGRMMATLGAAAVVLLIIGYISSASTLQEDLQGPAR